VSLLMPGPMILAKQRNVAEPSFQSARNDSSRLGRNDSRSGIFDWQSGMEDSLSGMDDSLSGMDDSRSGMEDSLPGMDDFESEVNDFELGGWAGRHRQPAGDLTPASSPSPQSKSG
jgi:hypothetical protein